MEKLLLTENNVDWVGGENVVETFMSNKLPQIELCPSSYTIVFKNNSILMTDLKEGERPTRRLDIPGGHVDEGESPEESAIRETFEEAGVRVKVVSMVGYKKITMKSEKPKDWPYPYPTGYMAFYLGEVSEETDFHGNDDTYGRVWLPFDRFEECEWTKDNKIFIDEIISAYEASLEKY